ncbi:hypothetical protein [Bradyrhizobium elkanii]|uniref:hypothetical protein n=1 Tax=Bradyrhizobium elkanii TaxID=29448 RepID=UPI001FD91F6B|nr:hypothetical protein [Bradyrhizobium elkanii]
MGRYATRENEVDDLLRAEIFVDLYSVVRHSIRASVESYSIKKLEPLYSFVRAIPLEEVGATMARTQARLEMADADDVPEDDKAAIRGYNRDDCSSTEGLRDWLEKLRAALVADGSDIERPAPSEAEIGAKLDDRQRKVAALVARLTEGVPDDVVERSSEQRGRWLLAHMLDWHGRENKSVWWEYFRLRDLSTDDLLYERDGVADLTFLEPRGGTAKAPIHPYSFTPQDTDIRADDELRSVGGEKFGRVVAISLDDRTIDIKKRADTAGLHPAAVFAHSFVDTQVLADALMRIGEYVADHGMEGDGDHRAARDLLMTVTPHLRNGQLQVDGEGGLAAATRIAVELEESVFPVQGPPGAGKTFTGARMILALARQGRTVGITANSHKVIRNLLDEVRVAAREQGGGVECIQKLPDKENDLPGLRFTTDNAAFLDALNSDRHVGGATGWFWARPGRSGMRRCALRRRGRPNVASERPGCLPGRTKRRLAGRS